jgi:hypothetical protein
MATKFNKAPEIGPLLRKYVKEKRIYQSGWARKQGTTPLAVARYLKRPDMKISTLFTICQVLSYNFIREIADQLPAEFPPHTTNPLQQRVSDLEEENKMLKKEVAVLKEVLGARVGK